jgi:hypothetical protein
MKENNTEIVIYQAEDGNTKIDVRMIDETVWLSLDQLSELFQRDKSTISRHIKNIFDERELARNSVVANFATTAADGKTYQVDHYNLDVIISVGYRIKSLRGTQFRIWATGLLREYLIKGFTMNDDLLKKAGGGDYWRELLDRIRDIRSSEKVFYRQVLDLYATSVDYDPGAEESQMFFKIVQNKIHYAAQGHTAAEIIAERANAESPFMGLSIFAGEQPRKGEIGVAKNYLNEMELATLNRMVSAFFDLAELRAIQHTPMHMKDWIAELDIFAKTYGKGILPNAGVVSHKEALEKAEREYEKYRERTKNELPSVERIYLESVKGAQKKIESSENNRKSGQHE